MHIPPTRRTLTWSAFAFALGLLVGQQIDQHWLRSHVGNSAGDAFSPPFEAKIAAKNAKSSVTGEIFAVANDGRACHARGAIVYVFESSGPEAKKWSDGLAAAVDKSENRMTENLASLAYLTYSDAGETETSHTAMCDSSGRFNMMLPNGRYIMIAIGQAGYLRGVWLHKFSVPADGSISLSMPFVGYTK